MRRSPATDVGLALIAFPAALFVAGWLALAVGAHLSGWLMLPALLAAAALGMSPGSLPRRLLPLGALAFAVPAALRFGAAFYDVSWDGQAYHQEAVLALADGWNPLWQGPLSIADRADNVWIDHYPKGAWIAQAVLFRAIGTLEAAKGLQLVAALGAGLLAFVALRERGVGRRWAGLVAPLAALNPVAAAQAYSFYVDGLGLSLVVAAAALGSLVARRPEPRLLLGLALALVLFINLKFTGVVYGACFVAGGAALAFWTRAAWRPFLITGAAALALGTLGLGFDPYVTNTVRAGHPFHPVMGAKAMDFIGIQLDPAFHRLSRPHRFLVGVLARGSNQNVAPVTKLPFTVGSDELAALSYADVRLGGFGPLWSGLLALGAVIALLRTRIGLHVPRAAWGVVALLLVTAFVNPALWWARYVPQLWLLPVGLLALAARERLTAPGRALRAALALLLLADLGLVAGAAAVGQAQASAAVREELAALAGTGPLEVRFAGFEANGERLRARHIPFRAVAALGCAQPRQLYASLAAACPAPVAAGERP